MLFKIFRKLTAFYFGLTIRKKPDNISLVFVTNLIREHNSNIQKQKTLDLAMFLLAHLGT